MPSDPCKLSYRVRVSSIQRVGEGQDFDKFRCFFWDLTQNLPKGVPEQPFARLGDQKCSQVVPNGSQNPSQTLPKWCLESTWFPLGPQILPGWAREPKKGIKNDKKSMISGWLFLQFSRLSVWFLRRVFGMLCPWGRVWVLPFFVVTGHDVGCYGFVRFPVPLSLQVYIYI